MAFDIPALHFSQTERSSANRENTKYKFHEVFVLYAEEYCLDTADIV